MLNGSKIRQPPCLLIAHVMQELRVSSRRRVSALTGESRRVGRIGLAISTLCNTLTIQILQCLSRIAFKMDTWTSKLLRAMVCMLEIAETPEHLFEYSPSTDSGRSCTCMARPK